MHRYVAYGLSIATSIPLPELPPADPSVSGAPDIQFFGEPLGTPPEPGSVPASTDGQQVVIAWGDYVTLRMRGGHECAFDTSEALAEAMLRRYLLGPGLGILLHQRGLLVLHASAVNLGGEAVLFIGEKGAGKSTTAAGLLARGHTLLSDDVVAIDLTDPARPLVLPAFAQIRLRPDSAAAVEVPDDELATTNLTLDKRLWQVHDRFQSAPVPLREINVLDRGVPGAVERLASDAALAQLLTHLYAPRFAGTSVMTGAHLQACATLLGAVIVRRLSRSESMRDLPILLDTVEGDGRAA
ncbi:MAG: serine kinase [Rhodothermales bacterium]